MHHNEQAALGLAAGAIAFGMSAWFMVGAAMLYPPLIRAGTPLPACVFFCQPMSMLLGLFAMTTAISVWRTARREGRQPPASVMVAFAGGAIAICGVVALFAVGALLIVH